MQGQAQMTVTAGTYVTQHTFLVVKDLATDLLMGEDFWSRH